VDPRLEDKAAGQTQKEQIVASTPIFLHIIGGLVAYFIVKIALQHLQRTLAWNYSDFIM
jgi:hypothetical protein